MPARKYRRDHSEVSCCLKYVIFSFNVIFWLTGLGIMAVGIWAWTEKDTFSNLQRLTNIALDPAFILIVSGAVTFIIGFTGCVGALRENTCLLSAYAIFLAILLLLEMTAGILGFIFKDWIKQQATGGFQAFIVHYRDDPDQQNLIDWIQEGWLQCCGIEGPKDWDRNIYFNCSSAEVGSREACGVPFSCCKPQPNEIIKNKQCGYDVRKPDYPGDRAVVLYERGCLRAGEEWVEINLIPVAGVAVATAILQNYDVAKIINDKGCLPAGEEWLERNLLVVAGVSVGIAFLQEAITSVSGMCNLFHYLINLLIVGIEISSIKGWLVMALIENILGICFAQNLRADIFAQKSKWGH